MYCYIYDLFLSDKKYERQLEQMENQLREFGIQGKIYKLNVLKNIKNIVDEAVASGVRNIVAVGNDQTISKVASYLIGRKITLGLLPFGKPHIMSTILGIPDLFSACKILAGRKVAKLDIGQVNHQFFFISVEPPDQNVYFDLKEYQLKPRLINSALGLYNFNIDSKPFKSRPDDGIMEAVFVPRPVAWFSKLLGKKQLSPGLSVFPVKELVIRHKRKPVSVNIDRQRVLKTPLAIKVLPARLEVIVGRERVFE